MSDYKEKYIAVADGLRLYVRDYENMTTHKRPVLCLSGLTRNSRDFEDIAPVIQGLGHRVVTLDYRGRGRSEYDSKWENYQAPTYVSDIFNVASALGLHGCILIGTSLGGLLSMAMSVVSPSLVHRVVLNDVGPDLDEEGLSRIIAYTGDGTPVGSIEEAVAKLKTHYQQEVAGFSDEDWHSIAQKTYKLVDGRYLPDWDVKIADSLRLSVTKEQREDLWPYFKALGERRVLLLRGQLSSVFKSSTYERMLTTLPHITGVEIPDVGHAPTLNEEKARNSLLAFLEE